MRSKFVMTANVKTFLAALSKSQERGARESSWIAAAGQRGLGKTRTLQWWSLKQQAIYVRAKTDWTGRWLLEDIAKELGIDDTARRKKDLFVRVVDAINATRTIIVVDEVELQKFRGNIKCLETLRDISDYTEYEVVLGGDPSGINYVLGYDQFSSRIPEQARCEFVTASLDDVGLMCRELAEVQIAADLVATIHRQSGGFHREIKNAIREVELFGQVNGLTSVSLEAIGDRSLCANRGAPLRMRGKA